MKWKGRRRSSNVRDARSSRVGGGRASGAGISTLINFVLRTFGFKGILILAAVGIVGWQLGLINPAMLTGGAPAQNTPYKPSAEEEARFQFVQVVLADTEDIWNSEFARAGRDYREPTLVIYRGQTATKCGTGDARMGPFYCPADETIYIDLGFYDDLAKQFDAPGDFAQAYVIAHEIGHHVQRLLGLTSKVAARRGQPDYNQMSVRLELQADYLAGVWARQNSQYLDSGDIDEAMRAANQIGDDAIQRRTRGKVVPHAFTHGTSEQRMRWFNRGFNNGSLTGGDTFAIPYEQL
ncbi:MAG: metalloprotease [Gammaproteobacteria bacterium]|nr:metalloprotease [Gammaproteobacteria bacterium]